MDIVLNVAGTVRRGRAIDARSLDLGLDPQDIVESLRDTEDDRLRSPDPGPVHDHVGVIQEGMSISLHAAVAAAARSVDAETPYDAEIERLTEERAAIEIESVSMAEARSELADVTEDVQRLREEVARIGGAVETRRSMDADPTTAEARLEEVAAELAEAETRRIAAEQRYERLQQRAAVQRDRRDRRMELGDRLENRRRAARSYLVEHHYPSFRQAIEAIPGRARPGDRPSAFDGDAVTAALAIARMAEVEAPLVIAVDRFSGAEQVADLLESPVMLLDG